MAKIIDGKNVELVVSEIPNSICRECCFWHEDGCMTNSDDADECLDDADECLEDGVSKVWKEVKTTD